MSSYNSDKRSKGLKKKVILTEGIVYINATFNNTIVSVTNTSGDVVSFCSAGMLKFKGAKKGTPFAAQLVSKNAVKKAVSYGLKKVDIHVKGPGLGREGAMRGIDGLGVSVGFIKDFSPLPHNGCRAPKKRRM